MSKIDKNYYLHCFVGTTRKPHAAHRADYGKPRVLPKNELERYCELIAALKLRTTNKQGRHLSTGRAIELMENYGVETAQELVKVPKGLLRCPTVNRYLSFLRLDQPHLLRTPPAVRFQAEYSNDCWQFDIVFLVYVNPFMVSVSNHEHPSTSSGRTVAT